MNEQHFKPAWRSLYWHFIAIILLLAIAGAVSVKWLPAGYQRWLWGITAAVIVCVLCGMFYKRNSVVLIIGPDKISLENGLISRQSVEISTRKVSAIQVKQSIVQRILNVGDIQLASSGTDEYEITARDMPSPHEIRESIHVTGRHGTGEGEDNQEAAE